MIYDKLNKYGFTFAALYSPKILTEDLKITRMVFMERSNFNSLKAEEDVPNAVSPYKLIDWWHYLVNFAEKHPQISYASDVFSWKHFKKHFANTAKQHQDCMLMVLDPLKTGRITYDTIVFIPHTILKIFVTNPVEKLQAGLKLPPMVTYRTEYPNFRAHIVNWKGQLTSIGVFSSPEAANRAQVREQIAHLDKMLKTLEDIDDDSLTLEERVLRRMRNRIVQQLSKTLTVSYPLTGQMIKKLLAKARQADRRRLLALPDGPSDAEIEEAVNRAATEQTISEVNAELRKSAKHLRDDIDVIGEDYAYQYTRDFLEKRSQLNRKQLIIQRRLEEELEFEEEEEVAAEFKVDKSLYKAPRTPEEGEEALNPEPEPVPLPEPPPPPAPLPPAVRRTRRPLKRPEFFKAATS